MGGIEVHLSGLEVLLLVLEVGYAADWTQVQRHQLREHRQQSPITDEEALT